MILGFLLGAYVCHRILGGIFVKCCTRLMEIPVIIIKFLIKWLLFPVKRCKLLKYKLKKALRSKILTPCRISLFYDAMIYIYTLQLGKKMFTRFGLFLCYAMLDILYQEGALAHRHSSLSHLLI